jgi:hypothetical protein
MDKDGNKEDRFGMQIANPNLVKQTEPLEKRMDKNAGRHPASSRLWSTPKPTRSLMVVSVDFDFHHSFLIILVLFATSVLAIFYLSCLFALAQMVYKERVASNGGKVR